MSNERPELYVTFDLRRGDMVFVNNNVILHNRTAFDDYDDPARKRLLVRLWLSAEHG